MRHIIIHGHMFKNAGTTFDWSLKENFGKGFLDHREGKLMRDPGRAAITQLVNDNPGLCALSSHHMTRRLPELEGVNFIPVNFLRHPIVRIRSVYNFERKQGGGTPGAVAAREKSFRDYVAWRMQPKVARTVRNYQTFYLAGCSERNRVQEITTEDFCEALRSVGPPALIGVVERYDESMVVLEESLREYFPDIDLSYVAQNVSKKNKRDRTEAEIIASILADMGDDVKQLVDENSFDLALYQAATVALQAKIDAPDDFSARLEDFQRRCKKRSRGFFSRFSRNS